VAAAVSVTAVLWVPETGSGIMPLILILMLDTDWQDRLKVVSSEDERLVEAFTPERADEPLGQHRRRVPQ
jgi:hypothetical protein